MELEQKKYSQYLDTFFPPPHALKVQYVEEKVLTYVTPYKMAQKVSDWIISQHTALTGSPLSGAIDGTSNIGGNLLNFCAQKPFKTVIGVEIDTSRFEALAYNVALYAKQLRTKPALIHSNFIDWWIGADKRDFKSFCLFLDPPWGDSEYILQDSIIDLPLYSDKGAKYSLLDIIALVSKFVGCIVLKLPFNYKVRTITEKYECYAYLVKKVQYIYIRGVGKN